MFLLGKTQRLIVSKITPQGYYLREPSTTGIQKKELGAQKENRPRLAQDRGVKEVLLPKKLAKEQLFPDDLVDVFLYRDSEDRLIATTQEPALTLGETALLTVKDTGPIGAFLDWNLEKDLLLPFHEQLYKVEKGDKVLVALYLDKSSRLCATMNLYDYLRTDSPFEKDDVITGRVYNSIPKFGVYVAVEDRFSGMIPAKEVHKPMKPGTVVEARITWVHSDGKLDLSLQKKTSLQMDEDAAKIYQRLQEAGGFLPFHDKTDKETIQKEFQISKNAFKRAIGRLLKDGKILITENGIQNQASKQ